MFNCRFVHVRMLPRLNIGKDWTKVQPVQNLKYSTVQHSTENSTTTLLVVLYGSTSCNQNLEFCLKSLISKTFANFFFQFQKINYIGLRTLSFEKLAMNIPGKKLGKSKCLIISINAILVFCEWMSSIFVDCLHCTEAWNSTDLLQ